MHFFFGGVGGAPSRQIPSGCFVESRSTHGFPPLSQLSSPRISNLMTSPPSTSQQNSYPATLPSPSTFDILPPLHALLARLLLPPSQTTFSPSTITSSPALAHPANTTPLTPKDLATAASPVKIKIQKARAVVRGLPDIERSIEEQECEIAELESEVQRAREVIRGMREAARKALDEGQKG